MMGYCFEASAQYVDRIWNDTLQLNFSDSNTTIVIDMGDIHIDSSASGYYLKVHFEYNNIDEQPAIISKTFTSDPHYICAYPHEPMMEDSTYFFVVCFANRTGPLNKVMGFNTNSPSGEIVKVSFRFKGEMY